MSSVGIFGKRKHPDVIAVAATLARLANERGWRVLAESTLEDGLEGVRLLQATEVAAQADLVVVLGGDGTMIRVVHLLDDRQVPIFGVNLGFLGYMTEFTVEEAAEQFTRALAGDFCTYKRARLAAKLSRGGATVASAKVLNDVVVNMSGMSRIIEIQAEIDGIELTTYRADGLIVSTPTGSTAYSLSAGGPIVAPGVMAILVTPICPHTLSMRPLVVQADCKIRLKLDRLTEAAQVTFDGQHSVAAEPGDRLLIEKAPGHIFMATPPRNYFEILRAKLKWGQS
ncbi:MAG TPA: NAD(+)/NADH kinase [Myxococcota bacterium]|nr:NAD(+)/NADH kinase [Myxococcota bacterium]